MGEVVSVQTSSSATLASFEIEIRISSASSISNAGISWTVAAVEIVTEANLIFP